MNQIVKFISTINSRLNSLPVENGNLIFVEDARKIVLDFHGKRSEYTQFITLESEDQRLSLLAPLDLFYFVKNTGILWRYSEGWIQITSSPYSWVSEIKGVENFPQTGQSNIFYTDMTQNKLYRWDATEKKYYCLSGLKENDIEIINGGSST